MGEFNISWPAAAIAIAIFAFYECGGCVVLTYRLLVVFGGVGNYAPRWHKRGEVPLSESNQGWLFAPLLLIIVLSISMCQSGYQEVPPYDPNHPMTGPAIDGGPLHKVETAPENIPAFFSALREQNIEPDINSIPDGRNVCWNLPRTVTRFEDIYHWERDKSYAFVGAAQHNLCKITKVDNVPVQ